MVEYSRYVFGLLRRLGVAEADVDDVAQEVMLAVHTKLPSFRGRSSFKTWLCAICRHKAADYRDARTRRERCMGAVAREPKVDLESPYDDVLHSEAKELLRRAIAHLPARQLEAFVLHEIEQLSMQEVARAMGCPVFTAYTRHRVARKRVHAFVRRATRGLGAS